MEKNGTVLFLYHCSVLHYCSVFVPQFRFCTTVPFLYNCSVFPQRNKKWNSVFLYHCSVFSSHCYGTMCFSHNFSIVFFIRDNGTKRKQCVFVPLFHLHYCYVFVPLFRFCTTVPFFHNGTKKNRNGVFLYHCSVFPYHRSVFCTTVPFFSQETTGQKQNNMFFCTIFRCFFHKGQRIKTEQCGCFNFCSVYFIR